MPRWNSSARTVSSRPPDRPRTVFATPGPASIRAAWQAIFDDDSTRFEPEETVVMGERAVQRWRYEWDGGHVRGVDLFRIRGDEIVEKLSYVKG